MKILVTRPSPTGEELVNNLNDIGIFAYHFSLFDFLFNHNSQGLTKNVHQLYRADIIIIFSKQAIYYTNLYLEQHSLQWPLYPKYYAIGKSTAFLLHQYIKKKLLFLVQKKIANLY